MDRAHELQKYWITACDAQRRVIFNQIITTGSLAEAQMIAEDYVPAEHHGSICITDESNNPVVDDAAGLPTFRAVAMPRSDKSTDDRNARIAELTEQLVRAWNLRLQAGEQRAISDLHNVVLERLTEADAAAIFVQAVQDEAGAAQRMQQLAAEAMRAECENDALKQIEQAEQRRAESANDNRIERASWAREYA